MGNLEGITFIDSRPLHDIQCYQAYRNYEWDYRWMDHSVQARNLKHPYDQSVSTYKGHSVLSTLILCYFSPEYRCPVCKLRSFNTTSHCLIRGINLYYFFVSFNLVFGMILNKLV